MGSRWVRTVVVIVALATLGFAGNEIRVSNAALAEEQGGERVFTDLGWTLTLTLADLRSAQQAYVADGQDGEYWASQVAAHLDTVFGSLENLKQQVEDPDALAALDDAVTAVGDIRELDRDARGYIGSDQPLQASDLIFTRGVDLVDRAGAHVQAARQVQRSSRLDAMTAARATQARMLWTAAAVVVLSMLVLAPASASSEPDGPSPATEDYRVPESDRLTLVPRDGDSEDDVDLSPAHGVDEADAPEAADGGGNAALTAPAAAEAGPDLGKTAALCTGFSNLTNRDQLPDLLAQTAALMNAAGLVVWTNNERARALQLAMSHGYAPRVVERNRSIPHAEPNPTSRAFATGRIQVIKARDADTGALAVPLMAAERCIGVLSAELRQGWESSAAVQATASIVAAQLAPLLPSGGLAAKPLPAAATGTHDTTGADRGAETVTPSSS